MMLQAKSNSHHTPFPASLSPVSVGGRKSGTLELMGAPMCFKRNCEIYGEGEPADYLYKIVSGTVRTSKVLSDGRRQIGAFHLPGDVFGLESTGEHSFSAEAIGDVRLLVVKRSALEAAATRDTDLARQLWTLAVEELRRVQDHLLVLIRSAEQRVASFLLEMSNRLPAGNQIDLPMSRQDIADYLGLTIETVSRTMTHLESEAAIDLLTSRRVVLRDRTALRRLNS
jgi:CRP/FNR family nitrogen fixation transcriptional regulator